MSSSNQPPVLEDFAGGCGPEDFRGSDEESHFVNQGVRTIDPYADAFELNPGPERMVPRYPAEAPTQPATRAALHDPIPKGPFKGSTATIVMYDLKLLQEDSYERAVRKGFDIGNTSQQLMLVSDELSEAHEFYRKGKIELFFQEDGKPDGFPVELADAVIRLAALARHHNIDLAKVIALKAAYNETRPYKHGKVC